VLPSGERAKNARSLVSVCRQYGNIIWLPWQRPWQIRYRSIIDT